MTMLVVSVQWEPLNKGHFWDPAIFLFFVEGLSSSRRLKYCRGKGVQKCVLNFFGGSSIGGSIVL